MNFKISVIVPIYNSENYLDECIQSILNQTYTNLEIILINDGSTDKSFEICNIYAKKDKRVILINQENFGQSAARNRGLEIATGDYISFVDSDDTISLDLYVENINLLKNNPLIEIVQFPVYKLFGTENSYLKINIPELITSKELIFKKWLEDDIISWIVCDKIFKKEVLKNLRFENAMIYEDNFMLTEILNNIKNIIISNKGIYFYHSRPNSTTTSKHTLKKDLDTQKVSLNILSKLSKIENMESIKVIILSRIYYVYESLVHNFDYKLELDNLFVEEFQKMNIIEFIKSGLPLKQKLNLIVIKIVGLKKI